jgi:molybdopterin-guanine dinucleotide biosynthesis protein A
MINILKSEEFRSRKDNFTSDTGSGIQRTSTRVERSGIGDITAIVLAGGLSLRMGGPDKSMLPVNGVPLIQHIVAQLENHFREIIIGGDEKKYSFLGHKVVPDEAPGSGPLMGVYSCLARSVTDLNFITACDIPEISLELIEKMVGISEGADIVMPVSESGEYEPLHAIYRRSVLPAAGKMLGEGRLKLSELAGKVETRYIRFDGCGWYHNLNNKDDYESYKGLVAG